MVVNIRGLPRKSRLYRAARIEQIFTRVLETFTVVLCDFQQVWKALASMLVTVSLELAQRAEFL